MKADDNNRDDSWAIWLEKKMEVATMPRLVKDMADGGFDLSDDFAFIIKNFPSSDALLLFRDNWSEYSKYMDADQRKRCNEEDKIFRYDDVMSLSRQARSTDQT